MRLALRILLPAILAVALALWLRTVPGAFSFQVADIAVEAPIWVGGLAVLALLVLLVIVMRLLSGFRVGRARRAAAKAMRRRDEGDAAVVSALAALAAGDGAGALSSIGRAKKRLGDTPLTLLVSGHAARALKDERGAKAAFERLSVVGPPGAFLGYRGLATLALEGGNKDDAAAAGRLALAMRPEAAWAKALVFDAAARAGDWAGALALLPKARKGTEEAARRAVLLLGAAEEEPDPKAALKLVEEAVELAPDLAPAHAARVKLLALKGERRRANQALERGIMAAAHPLLTALALEPRPGEDAAARARRVEALAGYAGQSGEAELMAADAAREAGLWAKARRHAQRAREAGCDDRRVFTLLAAVATAEHGDSEAGRAEAALHLREAAAAPQEPGWWCAACGTRHEAWAPVCPSCGAVATLRWGTSRAAAGAQPTALLAAPMPGL
jgi:HemY protein